MQSYRQYRRIGQRAEAQVARDLEKARLVTARNGDDGEEDDDEAVRNNGVLKGVRSRTQAPGQSDVASRDQNEKPASGADAFPGDDVKGTSRRTSVSQSTEEIGNMDEENVNTQEQRNRLARLDTARTQYTARAALGHTLTGIVARDRITHEGNRGDKVFVVGWENEADPENPRNWNTVRRSIITLQIALIAVAVCASSSIDAAILPQAAETFGVSEVVESLATGKRPRSHRILTVQVQRK
jgi:hypothetical protein